MPQAHGALPPEEVAAHKRVDISASSRIICPALGTCNSGGILVKGVDEFGVSDRKFRRAVGEKGLHQLERLRDWVFRDQGCPSEEWACRYAPSIIARSEAELFGVSVPRFAIRVYLDKERRNFVNARRIGEFAASVSGWGTRQAQREHHLDAVRVKWLTRLASHPARTIRKNTCVGDCLLRFQERDGWDVLETELGVAYGEGTPIVATPYVRHISLPGGGLCAQACAFMATSLLHQHCHGVYGVAEVTALAAPPLAGAAQPPPVSEMKLTGLLEPALLHYFKHRDVGLRATRQFSAPPAPHERLPLNRPFRRALAAYLASGMPVVLPLDFGRMAGLGYGDLKYEDSIFGKQHPRIAQSVVQDSHIRRPRPHATLLVGCGEQGGFLLSDPATYPFLKVDAEQLVQASCYLHRDMKELAKRVFIPVTPAAVKLPLESYQEPYWHNGRYRLSVAQDGLLNMVGALRQRLRARRALRPERPWEFRLLPARELLGHTLIPGGAVPALRRALGRWAETHPDHWCWLHIAKGSLWVWDAQQPPPSKESLDEMVERHVLCGLALATGQWSCVIEGPVGGGRAQPSPTPAPQGPFGRCSLISSARIQDCEAAIRDWPDGSVDCDLYCYMQPDAGVPRKLSLAALRGAASRAWRWVSYTVPYYAMNWWRAWFAFRMSRHYGFPWVRRYSKSDPAERLAFPVAHPELTAVETMALSATSRLARAKAKALHKTLRDAGLKCAALTSYIPEIIASSNRIGRRARKALKYLVLVGRELRALGHPVCTLEIVAGSLIDGVWPAREVAARRAAPGNRAPAPEEHGGFYVANRLSDAEALRRLLLALEAVVAEVQNAKTPFGLAIELEPGPLYAVSDLDSVANLCNEVDRRSAALRAVVGLNLDVAHWSLARISPEKVHKAPAILRRILHAHVSDHGDGHFGDVEVGAIHKDPRYFAKWLAIARKAATNQDPDLPPRSGYISIELEACKDLDAVRRSIKFLRRNHLVES